MTMAETALDATSTHDKVNNNHPQVLNHNHRSSTKQRKRKRLSQVLDKLTGGTPAEDEDTTHNNNNNTDTKIPKHFTFTDVFRFDKTKPEAASEEDDLISPTGSSNKSPRSTDSPRISFSPLRLKDDHSNSPPLLDPPASSTKEDSSNSPPCPCNQCLAGIPHQRPPYDRFFPAAASPAPRTSFERYFHSKYLSDIFRRRSHSDPELPLWFESAKFEHAKGLWPHPLSLPVGEAKGSSPQDSPLDLSVKGSMGRGVASFPPPMPLFQAGWQNRGSVSVPVVKGDVASPTTKESVASRYNLEVSPVVEEMPPGSDVAYVCPVCGQMFSLHDRLAKHMASRHKSRQSVGDSNAKAYLCEVCNRSFARSDMLTRHMRLHTGVKPYTCRVCGQVFSRSDHLSTHQRTHTGEKPYKCPQCPYAACRRDMITRHMRTHARYEAEPLAATPIKTEHL